MFLCPIIIIVVLLISMGGEWSFDQMITTQYGCQDMAYDPRYYTAI